VLLNCHGAEGKLNTMRNLCQEQKADVLLLTETWAHSDNSLPDLPDFVQWSTARPKARNKRGKYAGGVAIYIRQHIAKHMTVISSEAKDDKIWFKLHKSIGLSEDLSICLLYLPPESKHHSRSNIAKTYCTLSGEVMQAREAGSVILAGDLNARTGELQEAASLMSGVPMHIQPVTEFLPPRASLDSKSCPNSSGRSLIELCDTTDLVIVNGRTNKDSTGSYTHQSATRGNDGLGGKSLVDYFVVDRNFFQERVQDLSVSDAVINSDHSFLLLEVDLDCDSDLLAGRKLDPPGAVTQRFKINEEKQDIYVDMLRNDPRLDCQYLKEISDKLHAAVSVQKTILDVATTCFGMKPSSPKTTFPSNGWYDRECEDLQKKFMALVKSGANAELRFAARKIYRTLARSKKRQFNLKQAAELCKLAYIDPTGFWRKFKGIRRPLRLRDKHIWYTHFSELLASDVELPGNTSQTIASAAGLEITNRLFNPHGAATLNDPFSVNEIDRAIAKMRNNKAAGTDGMKPEFLKIGREVLAPVLTIVFNKLFLSGSYPTEWSKGVIVPCFKSGDAMKPENYRGITLVPMLDKLFAIALCTRISNWTEEKHLRANSQAGFRKDHRTSDQLFIHRTIIETSAFEKKSLFCAYIDYSKAFDTIPRNLLWERLAEIGIHGHMLRAIQSMYKNVSACVFTPEGITHDFPSDMGVKQGCALSPLLFGLFIDELQTILERDKDFCQPPYMAGVPVCLSLFADDSKLYSWSSRGLQHALNVMADFSAKKGLIPNPKKTKIMVWKNMKTLRDKDLLWTLNGVKVDVVNEHVDLGLLVSQKQTGRNNWSSSCHLPLIKAATVKLHSIMRRAKEIGLQSPRLLCRLFDTLIRPSLTYGSEIWGVELGLLDHDKAGSVAHSVEKVHLQYLKRILGVKRSTTSTHVRGEFGRHPVVMNIWILIIKYFFRLREMDGGRLLCIAFKQSKYLASRGMHSWFHYADLGLKIIAEDYECKNTSFLGDQIRDIHLKKWVSEVQGGGTKRETYLDITGGIFKTQPYLEKIKSKANRRMLACFRTGSHVLRIETGRWSNEAQISRVCPLGCSATVENEYHFVFECPAYEAIRSKLKYRWLFKEPWSLSAVLQNDSPLICEYLALCFEHREALLA
jgi:exonuclease III